MATVEEATILIGIESVSEEVERFFDAIMDVDAVRPLCDQRLAAGDTKASDSDSAPTSQGSASDAAEGEQA